MTSFAGSDNYLICKHLLRFNEAFDLVSRIGGGLLSSGWAL